MAVCTRLPSAQRAMFGDAEVGAIALLTGVCRKKVMDTERRISKLWPMGKKFRAYDMNQRLLLPPDLREWLREDHLALYVSDLVDQMDLKEIFNVYEEGDLRGRPPYHPAMMVQLLIYGYCIGKMSS